VADLETVRAEVSLYSKELSKRSWCIIANKTDLHESAEHLANLKERFKRVKIHPISAQTGEGLDKLRAWLNEKIGYDVTK